MQSREAKSSESIEFNAIGLVVMPKAFLRLLDGLGVPCAVSAEVEGSLVNSATANGPPSAKKREGGRSYNGGQYNLRSPLTDTAISIPPQTDPRVTSVIGKRR